MARAFSAIDIEDSETLAKLEEIRDALNLGFKPVKKQKMHITLQFFKNLNSEELEEVKKGLENIEVKPFKAGIEGLGAFPSKDFIRVLWAGVENPLLYRLQEEVSNHTVESDNNHEFRPHITLLRVEDMSPGQKRKVQKTLENYEDARIGEIKVEKVKLFESRLKPEGTRYVKLAEKEL
ncbi:MAG: RNA 2',3'-cyclic phosphodiesterase [Candidatus Nanohalobium sp.]